MRKLLQSGTGLLFPVASSWKQFMSVNTFRPNLFYNLNEFVFIAIHKHEINFIFSLFDSIVWIFLLQYPIIEIGIM